MIPTSIYERMPYAYITLGISLFAVDIHPATQLLASLLYIQGGRIWSMRSSYRRPDRFQLRLGAHHPARCRRLVWLSEGIYEAVPFVYIGLGLSIWLHLDSPWAVLSGGLLMVAGSLVWRMRHNHRMVIPVSAAIG